MAKSYPKITFVRCVYMENPGWRKLTLFMKLMLLHLSLEIVAQNLGVPFWHLLIAQSSEAFSKLRAWCILQEQWDNLNSKWAEI